MLNLAALQAQIVISVGSIPLQPDFAAGQSIDVMVENKGLSPVAVLGLQFNLQIADGQGGTSAPSITAINLIAGTAFEPDNLGPSGGMVNMHRWEVGTIADFNPPNPLLPVGVSKVATITFNTIGFNTPESWIVSLATPAGATTYTDPATGFPLTTTLIDGTISVPEPQEYALAVGISLLWFGLARRHWKVRTAQSG